MNGLDLPLEALTFIPVNLATVISAAANNLWAWLAVITATLSLWRLRTTATKTTSPLISLPPPPPPTPTKRTSTTTTRMASFKCTDDIMQKQEEEEGVSTRGNSKKFFSVYFEEREDINQLDEGEDEYDDDDDDDNEMKEGGDEVENESRVVMTKRWGSSSELTVEMRRGDFGWYSYQNRKVIDGSVVRLWKEEREDGCCGSPRSCRSRRATALVLA